MGTSVGAEPVDFAVVGVDHPHAIEVTRALIDAGGTCSGWSVIEDDPRALFATVFPDLPRISASECLGNRPNLVVIAGVPNTRAMWATQALDAGADVLVSSPGAIGQGQLAEIEAITATTGRRWWMAITAHVASRAVNRAHQLVAEGRIGVPRHVVAIAPHRRSADRPDWFSDPFRAGSMIADLAGPQIHHAAALLGGTELEVVAARTTGWADGGHPDAIAELLLEAPTGSAYIRVDWLSPGGLPTWGDVRLMITGDAGTIEVRANIDLDSAEGGDHLLVVDNERIERVDCATDPLPWAGDLLADVRNRTETVFNTRQSIDVMRVALAAADQAKSSA